MLVDTEEVTIVDAPEEEETVEEETVEEEVEEADADADDEG